MSRKCKKPGRLLRMNQLIRKGMNSSWKRNWSCLSFNISCFPTKLAQRIWRAPQIECSSQLGTCSLSKSLHIEEDFITTLRTQWLMSILISIHFHYHLRCLPSIRSFRHLYKPSLSSTRCLTRSGSTLRLLKTQYRYLTHSVVKSTSCWTPRLKDSIHRVSSSQGSRLR